MRSLATAAAPAPGPPRTWLEVLEPGHVCLGPDAHSAGDDVDRQRGELVPVAGCELGGAGLERRPHRLALVVGEGRNRQRDRALQLASQDPQLVSAVEA